jgi:hypothetical protein
MTSSFDVKIRPGTPPTADPGTAFSRPVAARSAWTTDLI